MTSLIYVGNGSWLPDVPNRNLTAEEVELYGGEAKLLKSGLYQRATVEMLADAMPAEELASIEEAPTPTRWKKDKEK